MILYYSLKSADPVRQRMEIHSVLMDHVQKVMEFRQVSSRLHVMVGVEIMRLFGDHIGSLSFKLSKKCQPYEMIVPFSSKEPTLRLIQIANER